MNFLKGIMEIKGKVPHQTNPYLEAGLNALLEALDLNTTSPNIIGAFGDVVFEVSSDRVITMRDFKRQARGRYATHDIIGQKSIIEFLGTEPDEITFDMQLNADLGVKISVETAKLMNLLRSGEPNYLIVGGQALGMHQWCLTGLEYKYDYGNRRGEWQYAQAGVTLREYER